MSEKQAKKHNTISLILGALTAWLVLVGIYVVVGTFAVYLVKGSPFFATLTNIDNITTYAVMALLMTLIPLLTSIIRNKFTEKEGMVAMF